MPATLIKETKDNVTIQVTIPKSNSILEMEEFIQAGVNEVGTLATQKALEHFDTDGSSIKFGETKFTSKGQFPKEYQTPYGATTVNRHVYQTAEGGTTYCPMEIDAKIIITSTPKFAKILSSKYAEFGAGRVMIDLEENHGRAVHKSFIQNVVDVVASVALLKEENWTYSPPELEEKVASMSFGIDGTCVHMSNDGWRETMVGTLAFYNKKGDRLYTVYTAATPQYGKEKFLERMELEIERAKILYPKAFTMGIADGAKSNWPFLEKHTDIQILDFYHATEYLGKASEAGFKVSQNKEKTEWITDLCHKLKHNKKGASNAIKAMEALLEQKLSEEKIEKIKSAITYFKNNKHMMTYAEQVSNDLPIGSGVTEAACKVIVKQRLCSSGMRWKEDGAGAVLALRTLSYSNERWSQFWNKIDRYGLPIAA